MPNTIGADPHPADHAPNSRQHCAQRAPYENGCAFILLPHAQVQARCPTGVPPQLAHSEETPRNTAHIHDRVAPPTRPARTLSPRASLCLHVRELSLVASSSCARHGWTSCSCARHGWTGSGRVPTQHPGHARTPRLATRTASLVYCEKYFLTATPLRGKAQRPEEATGRTSSQSYLGAVEVKLIVVVEPQAVVRHGQRPVARGCHRRAHVVVCVGLAGCRDAVIEEERLGRLLAVRTPTRLEGPASDSHHSEEESTLRVCGWGWMGVLGAGRPGDAVLTASL